MACFSSITKPALVLHLLLLTLSHNTTVSADEKLIEQACHNAEVPITCVKCLKSDPKAKEADRVGIVTILINCLANHAKTLAADMSSLISSGKDQGLKDIYQECVKGYSLAEKLLASSKQELGKKLYDKAEKSVTEALGYEITCHENIINQNVPEGIFYEMRSYEEVSEATDRIIERL